MDIGIVYVYNLDNLIQKDLFVLVTDFSDSNCFYLCPSQNKYHTEERGQFVFQHILFQMPVIFDGFKILFSHFHYQGFSIPSFHIPTSSIHGLQFLHMLTSTCYPDGCEIVVVLYFQCSRMIANRMLSLQLLSHYGGFFFHSTCQSYLKYLGFYLLS